MTPDKTNTPDPVKLVEALDDAAWEYGKDMTQFRLDRKQAAKAALLAEFTRLADQLKSWNRLWGPVIDFAQANSEALGMRIGGSIPAWVLETMKERAALSPAPSPQGLAEKCARLEKAIRWALGEDGEFKSFNEGYKRYWWRPELRERAFQGQPTEPKCTCRTLDVGPNGGPYGNGHAEYCGWGRANPKAPAPTPSETLTAPAPYYPQGMIREYDATGKLTRTANPEFYKITRREEWTDPAPEGEKAPATSKAAKVQAWDDEHEYAPLAPEEEKAPAPVEALNAYCAKTDLEKDFFRILLNIRAIPMMHKEPGIRILRAAEAFEKSLAKWVPTGKATAPGPGELVSLLFDLGKAAQLAKDDAGLMRMTLRAVFKLQKILAPTEAPPNPPEVREADNA